MRVIIIDGKAVDVDSIELDLSMGIHESAKFDDGTQLSEDQLCHLDKIREMELMEAIQNFRRD